MALFSQSTPQVFIQMPPPPPAFPLQARIRHPHFPPSKQPISSTQSPTSRPLGSPRPSQSPWKLTNKGVWAIKGSLFPASVTSFLNVAHLSWVLHLTNTLVERSCIQSSKCPGTASKRQLNAILLYYPTYLQISSYISCSFCILDL